MSGWGYLKAKINKVFAFFMPEIAEPSTKCELMIRIRQRRVHELAGRIIGVLTSSGSAALRFLQPLISTLFQPVFKYRIIEKNRFPVDFNDVFLL